MLRGPGGIRHNENFADRLRRIGAFALADRLQFNGRE